MNTFPDSGISGDNMSIRDAGLTASVSNGKVVSFFSTMSNWYIAEVGSEDCVTPLPAASMS